MEFYDFAKELSLHCGKKMIEAFKIGALDVQEKSGFTDLVTKTDKEIEEYSKKSLLDKYSNHKFIGEESVSDGGKCDFTDDPTWILDPIDGTTNFINGFPYFCYSLGLYIKKEAFLGIVFNPFLNEFYHAIKGKGAFLNDKPIHVTKNTDLMLGIAVSDWGNDREEDKVNTRMENLRSILMNSRGVRSLGSAAMHLCTVAAGRADVYFEFGLHCWDMAAGKLIVEEAGGCCTSSTGEPLDLMKRRIIAASNMSIVNQVVKLIKAVDYPDD